MQAESVDTAEKTDKELKNKTKEVPTLGLKCCEKKHDSHGAVGGTIHGYKESFYSPIPPFPC